MPSLFHKIFHNILRCFSGYNLLWQIAAIVLTFILVVSGFDWFFFMQTRSALLLEIAFPAIVLGAILPVAVPISILLIGAMRRSKPVILAAFVMGQAAILGAVISAVYKALTGRIPPEMLSSGVHKFIDISSQFQFGFLRGGIFWGWPSSHTTIAFAMAVATYTLYAHNKKMKVIGILFLLYALYIGLSVSVSIHWFSEFIAGAVIGSVIGHVVGKSFREKE